MGLFVALVLVGAAALFTHLLAIVRVVSAPREALSLRLRWLVLVPPCVPWLAWKADRRVVALMWGLFWILYLALRLAL